METKNKKDDTDERHGMDDWRWEMKMETKLKNKTLMDDMDDGTRLDASTQTHSNSIPLQTG
jgi:hypothetical protein